MHNDWLRRTFVCFLDRRHLFIPIDIYFLDFSYRRTPLSLSHLNSWCRLCPATLAGWFLKQKVLPEAILFEHVNATSHELIRPQRRVDSTTAKDLYINQHSYNPRVESSFNYVRTARSVTSHPTPFPKRDQRRICSYTDFTGMRMITITTGLFRIWLSSHWGSFDRDLLSSCEIWPKIPQKQEVHETSQCEFFLKNYNRVQDLF